MSSSTGVALLPTDGIKDPQIRAFLDRLVEVWGERNLGDGRFITSSEVAGLATQAVADAFSGGTTDGQSVTSLINGLTNSILNSMLYQKLGEFIGPIDLNHIKSRINDVLNQAMTGITSEATARTTADLSLTSQINAAVSRIGTAEAAIVTEQTTRASADSALTTSLATQTSRIDTNVAAIATEQTTRASKDLVLASAINDMWASIGGSTAVLSDSTLAGATPSSAAATKWNQVVASVTDPNTGLVSSASIVQSLNTYANSADSSLNAIYTVRAQIAYGGTTVTGTAATVTPSVNNKGNSVLTLSSTGAGTIVAGMNVYGPGVRGGTTVSSVSSLNITLSLALNGDAVTTASAYTFSTQKMLVGGFGISATTGAGSASGPTIDFGVRADTFYIASSASTPDLTTQMGMDPSIPFIVVTTSGTYGGITYAPGVYIKKAIIADGLIDNAKIGNYIASTNFNGTINGSGVITANGTTGWAIDKSGNAVYNNIKVRGDIEATSLNGSNIVATTNVAANAVSQPYFATTASGTSCSLSVVIPSGSSGAIITVSPGQSYSGGSGKDAPGSWAPNYGFFTINDGTTTTTYHSESYVFVSPPAGTYTVTANRVISGGTTDGMYLSVTVAKR